MPLPQNKIKALARKAATDEVAKRKPPPPPKDDDDAVEDEPELVCPDCGHRGVAEDFQDDE